MFEWLDEKYPLRNQEKRTAWKSQQLISLAVMKLSILKTSHKGDAKARTYRDPIAAIPTSLSICCGTWKTVFGGYLKKIMKIFPIDFNGILVNTRFGSLIYQFTCK